jgi:hypothetical protein
MIDLADLAARLAEVERKQDLHTETLTSLIYSIDRIRENTDDRLKVVEKQLSALVETNHIIIDMLNTRLPPQRPGPDEATNA